MSNEKPVAGRDSRDQERPRRKVTAKTNTSDETIYVEFVTNLNQISDRDIENALVEHAGYVMPRN